MKKYLEKLVEMCGEDVNMRMDCIGTIHLDFVDFAGFDDDWNEIMRDYDNPQAVANLINWLNDNCLSCDEDFYATYDLGDFSVIVGYTSYDI